jgi:DNA invertase Pin-like site-specific DNA recombinase
MRPRKLTDEQAAEIRKQYKEGKRPIRIAKEFHVSTQTVWNIAHGRTHKAD